MQLRNTSDTLHAGGNRKQGPPPPNLKCSFLSTISDDSILVPEVTWPSLKVHLILTSQETEKLPRKSEK